MRRRNTGRISTAATMATAISGTLTRNAARHEKYSSRTPPTIGPTAAPRPDTAAQSPRAVARSAGSVKMLRSRDNVVGMIIAPPTPSSTRTAITASGDSASRTSAEAPPNTAKPVTSIRFRPHRSASELMESSRPARTSE